MVDEIEQTIYILQVIYYNYSTLSCQSLYDCRIKLR